MEKIVIYTCITGGYDSLLQPACTDERFDFVCFVPAGQETPVTDGVWTLRTLPEDLDLPDKVLSRYVKMHPHLFLPDCTCSVWVDGNVRIASAGAYGLFADKARQGVLLSGIIHPLRDCAYDEVVACVRQGRCGLRQGLRAVKLLADRNFPPHAGLLEHNVMFRRHNDPAVVRLDSLWWEMFSLNPVRDQFVLRYCMAFLGMTADRLLPVGEDVRTSPLFDYPAHPGYDPHVKRWGKIVYNLRKGKAALVSLYRDVRLRLRER